MSRPPERRARLLLRWYPGGWRARYGTEFAELLVADLTERPRCWQRTADVARSGLRARLASAGLAGPPLSPDGGARAGMATLACAMAAFLTAATAMWSQLSIGWQWSPPATRATAVAMVVMSAALAAFAVAALAAAVPVLWSAARGVATGQVPGLRRPALLAAAGALVLIVGGRHFGNGWPGTGGHWWPHQGLVPGGAAAFGWACTLWVTSYWVHPAGLAAFPPAELAWMAVSPAALACLVTGTAGLVRRADPGPRALRYQTWVSSAAGLAAAAYLSGALCWIAEGGGGPRGLFHAGVIDLGGLAAGGLALAIGWLALHRVRRAGGTAAG